MVIQRTWRSQSSVNISNNDNSSEDSSNSSNTNTNKRQPSTSESVLVAIKNRYSGSQNYTQSPVESAFKSLELLRSNIQNIFDKEIDVIVKKFIEMFFVPALKNIKENLNENYFSDDQVKKICCSLLDQSKQQYITINTGQQNTSPQSITPICNTPIMDVSSDSSNENITSSTFLPSIQYNTTLKRKDFDTTEQESLSSSSAKKSFTLSTNNNETMINSSTLTKQLLQENTTTVTRTRPIIWNTSVIGTESLFVLDIKASRALGLIDIKDRLTNKHPELIRYLMDNQDKDWLIQQKVISPLHKNSKYFILVFDEVKKLAENNKEYNRYLNTNLSDLKASSFKLSEFIYKKIQRYFNELNLKSRNFTTFNIFETQTITSHQSSQQHQQSSSSSSSSSSITQKPKSSLSTTHATLSALLKSDNLSSVVIKIENDP